MARRVLETTMDVIRWLKSFFSNQRGECRYNETQLESIEGWVDATLNTIIKRESFRTEIENHSWNYLPMLGDLRKVWNEEQGVKTHDQRLVFGAELSAQAIWVTLNGIRDRQFSGERLTNIEVDFLSTWGAFESIVGSLYDQNRDVEAEAVGRMIREHIIAGFKMPSVDVRNISNVIAYTESVIQGCIKTKSV